MSLIKRIKLPNMTTPYEIGVLSSNVVYDGTNPTTTLNSKISSMEQIIEGLNSFEISVVNSLPIENIDDHTIYFVPESQGSTTHNEYMYINNTWELIGTTTVDLTDYLQKSEISVSASLNSGTNIGSITIDSTTATFYVPSYSLSMSGPTITLIPSSGTASTITLPIYDGTVV